MSDLHNISEVRRTFIQRCLKRFSYLTRYGCELVSIDEDSSYGVEVTYKNQTTAVTVSLEDRENEIFVYLIRLVNGVIPDYLDAPSRWFYLDNLVKLKSSSVTLPQKEFGNWLTPADIDHFLKVYAESLEEYGEDVLYGDFSAFSELNRLIDRPRPSSSGNDIELITSNEELEAQKKRLAPQIAEYYDTYFSELRSQLQRPDVFYEAIPEYLKGRKRIISIGGEDGLAIAHFPTELEFTMSRADDGSTLVKYPSVINASEDFYEFLQLPEMSMSVIVTLLSEGEDIGLEISPEDMPWGVGGFNAPQQSVDTKSGELVWQAPWTRLICADLYHLRYWEDVERAVREAKEDIEPYVRNLEITNKEQEYPSHFVQWVPPEPQIQRELTVGAGLFSTT